MSNLPSAFNQAYIEAIDRLPKVSPFSQEFIEAMEEIPDHLKPKLTLAMIKAVEDVLKEDK